MSSNILAIWTNEPPLTVAYVDLAVNVRSAFGLSAGIRTLQNEGVVLAVIQRVLINGGPRRTDSAGTVLQFLNEEAK